ncbi:hypothetical protein [Thomasclavelia sp.]
MFTRLFDFKKRVIIILVIVILVGLTVYLFMDSKRELLIVKDDLIIIEYGQSISTDPKDYLNISELNTSDKDDVLKNTKLKSNVKNEIEVIDNADGTKSERDKGYAAVGTYKIVLKYKNETKRVKVVVRDTTKPELIVPENVELLLGTDIKNYDFKKLIQASDLADLNDYIIDTSLVDINKIGEYSVKVSIEDINKNKSEKEFKVIIISPPASDEEVVQEIIINDDGSKSVKVITKKNPVSSNDKSSTGSQSKPSNNKPVSKPSTGNIEDDSVENTDKNDSNSSQNNNNEDKNNGHYETFYCCLDHFSETYGKYHTLQELINAGHFTGGCGCNNYSYGEEWVQD